MTWAQTLNSSNVGNMLSNSMQNIKLDSNVSESEIQAKIAINEAKNKKTNNKENANTQNQGVQNPPQVQAAPQNQPQPQIPQYMPNIQYPQVQYQTAPINYQPYSNVQSANAAIAPYNAAGAYQAQTALQNQNGQNINLTTANVQQV